MTRTAPDPATPPARTVRARVVIVRDGAVALIARERAGRRYFVFPGGGVEPGETPEAAAAREAFEELGLLVAIGAPLAEVAIGDARHHFFLATPQGGRFGTGQGAEMIGGVPRARGTYRAVWLPIAALERATVYPRVVAALVVRGGGRDWPATPLRLREPRP